MTDLSQYSDSDLKALYLKSLPDDELQKLHEQVQSNGVYADGTPIPRDRQGFGGMVDSTVRQMELAGRHGFEGAAGLADMPAALWNLTSDSREPQAPYLSPTISKGLDAIGMPQDEGNFERLAGSVEHAVSGAKSLGATPQVATSAGVGGASGELARQNGAGPWGQFGASVLGGAAGGPLVYSAGKAVNDFAAPLYQGGRNQIMGNLLASQANDPKAAAAAITGAPQYIPGSMPPAGTLSGDSGLIGAQKGIQQLDKGAFSDAANVQLAAQNNVLGNVAGNPADIAPLQRARSTATQPFYEAATNTPYDPKILQPVLDNIDNEIAKVGTTTQAGKMLSDMKANIIAESDNPQKMGPLIQMYKENRDNFAKKMLQDGAVTPAVKGVVNPTNKALGNALSRNNEDVAYADATFKNMSAPINQIEAGQAIKAQVQGNSPNVEGQLPIIQPRFQQMMENGVINVDGKDIPISSLSAAQQKGLQALQSDLNRNTSVNRVPALSKSEFQNLATQPRLNALASHLWGLKGIFSNADKKIQQGLVDATLDPQLMAKLLMQGKVPATNSALARMMQNIGTGAGAGAATSFYR